MADQNPTTGVIDPATGQPTPHSGPSGGPAGAAAGTQARDVATRGTAGTETPGAQAHVSGAASGAQSTAADAAGTAKDKASEAADAARDKAADAAGQAQAKAQDVAGQAKEQLHSQLDQRSTQAGERATATASDLRSISDHLREQGNEAPAKLADNAAAQIEKAGSYLQRADGQSLLSDLEDFARRNPWAAALGGLAIGFAASRALKASSAERTISRVPSTPSRASLPAPTPSPVPRSSTPSVGAVSPVPPVGAPSPVPPTGPADATGYSIPRGTPGQPGTGAL